MKILAIDSSAVSASVAVSDDGEIIVNDFVNAGLTHSQTLMPMVENVINKANVSIKDVDLLAVTCGPGSFTGIRIGVATIKGLAFANNTKCVGVSTLEVIAMNMCDTDCTVLSCMDARRKQIYTATFDVGNGNFKRLTEDEACSIDSVAERISSYNKKVYIAGDGAKITYEILKEKCDNVFLPDEYRIYQNATNVCKLAYKYRDKSESAKSLVPTYLRLSQAERELNNRKGDK